MPQWLRGSNPHDPPKPPFRRFGSILKGQIALTRKYVAPQVRGNNCRHHHRRLSGAGAGKATWVSYSMSKRFSKEPDEFSTGHPSR